ncbi:ABC transporter permease subunit [Bacillus suaedaesalsae]|uniref:ABC transporter permease subunit n=1 Tax=Bacillus suaedaesalsae TaxID=2810349 RepID=A0ABS2DMQ5_9BACI|nr:ABC transporter permease subunit [Bacillus suaedaesalsae]
MEIAHNGEFRQIRILYDDKGNVIDSAPIAPHWWLPLGTDLLGFDLLMKSIDGAKHTIIIAFIIALLRIVFSLIIGLSIGVYSQRLQKYLNAFSESFHYIPLTLLAVYVLEPILWEQYPGVFYYSYIERLVLQVLLLTLLTLPMLSSLISNEVELILRREFIQSSKILGATRFFLIWKHILPHLKERIVILFGQQMIQVLIILAHLGIFKLFLGGTHVTYDRFVNDPPSSITNEWSGLIGDGFYSFVSAPWVFLAPIGFFTITIIAINFMMESYKHVTSINVEIGKKKIGKKREQKMDTQLVKKDLFVPLNRS